MNVIHVILGLRWMLWCALLWLPSGLWAQDQLLRFADHLAARGLVDSARHEYMRWLYFAEEPEPAAPVWFRLGQLEEQAESYEQARRAYVRCQLTTNDPKLRKLAIGRAGYCSLLLKQYAEGHFILQAAVDLTDSLGRMITWLDALCLAGLNEYSSAYELASKLYPRAHPSIQSLDSCLVLANKLVLRSATRAQWLSLIPGLGLFYAGAWLEGLRSLGLTGTAITLTAVAIAHQYYWIGLLSGALVTQRFYEGGARLAVHEVEQRNQKRTHRVTMCFLQALLRAPVVVNAKLPIVPE